MKFVVIVNSAGVFKWEQFVLCWGGRNKDPCLSFRTNGIIPWSFSFGQEIYSSLWDPKVHQHVYRSPVLLAILCQITIFYATHPVYWRSILILSTCFLFRSPCNFGTKYKVYHMQFFPPIFASSLLDQRVTAAQNRNLKLLVTFQVSFYICFSVHTQLHHSTDTLRGQGSDILTF